MVAVLVHGGAGPRRDQEDPEGAKAGCLAAAEAGLAVLERGGSALDAVEAAARRLEDDPRFNAGTGAVLNAEGTVELDASIMDGEHLRAGAVAVVKTVKNPITLARAVMEHSPHVLLVGDGADAFARTCGIPEVDPSTLITPLQRQRWLERVRSSGTSTGSDRPGAGAGDAGPRHGTIGAVAVDARGQVAAATSTGGTAGKLAGRVGDSPLIGCGTLADSRLGAASATGLGEYIIRVRLTSAVLNELSRGAPIGKACQSAIDELVRIGGDGGVIAVTPQGELGWAFSSERMALAWAKGDGTRGARFQNDPVSKP
jgi:L-asparaginase / beta-aspartyl-peptidase